NLVQRRGAIETELRAMGLEKFTGQQLDQKPEAQWFGELPHLLENAVDAEGANQARQAIAAHVKAIGPDAALYRDLHDFGLLSLVMRTRSRMQGSVAAFLASWNHWT